MNVSQLSIFGDCIFFWNELNAPIGYNKKVLGGRLWYDIVHTGRTVLIAVTSLNSWYAIDRYHFGIGKDWRALLTSLDFPLHTEQHDVEADERYQEW